MLILFSKMALQLARINYFWLRMSTQHNNLLKKPCSARIKCKFHARSNSLLFHRQSKRRTYELALDSLQNQDLFIISLRIDT